MIRKDYTLYVEMPGSGGYVARYASFLAARAEAASIRKHYPDAYIEVAWNGQKLFSYQGSY